MAKVHSPGFLRIANEARAKIQEISPQEVLECIKSYPRLVLIDVREDHEWNESHINDAIHIGRGILERDIEKTIPNLNTEIVVYCGGGYRSALAADSLGKMGYKNVRSMAGGFGKWVELGFGITKGK